MAVVANHLTLGGVLTLDATDEFTPWLEAAHNTNAAVISLQFDGSWSGTLRFEIGRYINGAWVADPVLATDLVDASTGTTTTGGTTTTEFHRIDLSGGLACRVYAQSVAAGSVTVTLNETTG